MQRSTLVVTVAAAIASAAIAAGACSFPTILIAGETSGSGGSTTSTATGATTGTGGAPASASTTSSATTSSAATSTAASSATASASSSSSGNPCNLDDDGDLVLSWLCGGPDCADNDKLAYPDAGYQGTPITGQQQNNLPFDYNCDGKQEAETPTCKLGACPAAGVLAFKSDVPCGVMAALGTCGIVGCNWVPTNPPSSGTQRCK
jgi:hypothetical protein